MIKTDKFDVAQDDWNARVAFEYWSAMRVPLPRENIVTIDAQTAGMSRRADSKLNQPHELAKSVTVE